MLKKTFLTLLCIFLLWSCTDDETTPQEEKEIIHDVLIELNIENNVVISSGEITITLTGDAPISKLEVLLDNGLLQNFSAPPYTFTIDPTNYEDGSYDLEVDVYADGEKVGSKKITVKIDNNGPVLTLNEIADNEIICGDVSLNPQINDVVSEVDNVKIYLNDILLLEASEPSDYSFSLIPDQLAVGDSDLKFIMEDAVGNISMDSIPIKIAKKIIAIHFPDNFVRENVDRMHILLSDAEGKFLDSKTHDSAKAETLEFCSFEEIDANTEFMLTFVSDFHEQVFGFYVYGNLTKAMLGNEILLPQRTAGLSPATIDMDYLDHPDGYYTRSSTPWSSMLYHSATNTFSGHWSKTYNNKNLAIDKAFIFSYHPESMGNYEWAFVKDIHTKFSLQASDFTSANVVNGNLRVDGSTTRPFLSIYGFNGQDYYETITGHMVYWNPALYGFVNYDYSYADIFDYLFYSAKVSNYSIEGTGPPPPVITVPGTAIDYDFSNNKISFSGLLDYEVGRMRLVNYDDAHINMEFIFDGQTTDIVVPELPSDLFPTSVTDIFENNQLEVIQGVSENYNTFNSYSDYISNVLVTSKPFYLNAPTRERIFKSSVGTHLLPINEFPFYNRF